MQPPYLLDLPHLSLIMKNIFFRVALTPVDPTYSRIGDRVAGAVLAAQQSQACGFCMPMCWLTGGCVNVHPVSWVAVMTDAFNALGLQSGKDENMRLVEAASLNGLAQYSRKHLDKFTQT